MARSKTHEEFSRDAKDITSNGYEILSDYTNAKTKIRIKHNVCGHVYDVLPHNFLKGRKCPNPSCRFAGVKKTNEEFLKEVYDAVGVEYTFIDEYVNSMRKLRAIHENCGNIYEVSPNTFLSKGARCPTCQKRKLKTTEEFKYEVFNIVGGEYTVVGEYINSATHVDVLHNACGRVNDVTPNRFLRGTRCPYCLPNSLKTTSEFLEIVHSLVGDEYEFYGEYINSQTRMDVLHKVCGHKYKVIPNNFTRGTRCPRCDGRFKTEDDFKNDLHTIINDSHEYLGGFVNYITHVNVRHKKCGFEYKTTPSNLFNGRGHGCRKCGQKATTEALKRSDEDFVKEVKKLVGVKYTFLEKYDVGGKKIRAIHNECGHIYNVEPRAFLEGNRCPKCRSSKGEVRIMDFLDSVGVGYIHQYRDVNCKNIRVLPFDFLVNHHDRKLIIEFDGEQHFKPVQIGRMSKEDAIKNYESQVLRDNIKNDFCIENDIPMLRIPYWDYENVEEIVFDNLVNHSILEEVFV